MGNTVIHLDHLPGNQCIKRVIKIIITFIALHIIKKKRSFSVCGRNVKGISADGRLDVSSLNRVHFHPNGLEKCMDPPFLPASLG